jgi:hypothetical protein
MCLSSNPNQVRQFLHEYQDTPIIPVYKVLLVGDSGKLKAPYMSYHYDPGLHEFTEEKFNNRRVSMYDVRKGFHCYLEKEQATKLAKRSFRNRKPRVVTFYVRPQELIGKNNSHAVFKNAILFSDDNKKALRGIKKPQKPQNPLATTGV